MCGGNLVRVPCSRVAHLYRLKGWKENDAQAGSKDRIFTTLRNNKRVAETWFNEVYIHYFLKENPKVADIDTGDTRAVRTFRGQCYPFDWFMSNVAYNSTLYFPPVELEDIASGKLINRGNRYCITNNRKTRFISFSECSDVDDRWKLTWHEDLQHIEGKL